MYAIAAPAKPLATDERRDAFTPLGELIVVALRLCDYGTGHMNSSDLTSGRRTGKMDMTHVDFQAMLEANLSLRSRHVLHKAGVRAVDDLLQVTLDLLAGIKGCGNKSIKEILEFRLALERLLDSGAMIPTDVPLWYAELDIAGSGVTYESVLATLSTRVQNVLRNHQVDTVEKFLSLGGDVLLSLKSIGIGSVNEVKRAQRLLLRDSQQHSDRSWAMVTSVLAETPNPLLSAISGLDDDCTLYRAILDHLSVRASNVLRTNNIQTLEHFCELTPADLFGFRACGRKTVTEIKETQRKLQDATGLLSARHEVLTASTLYLEVFGELMSDMSSLSVPSAYYGNGARTIDPEQPFTSLLGWLNDTCASGKKIKAFLLRKGMLGNNPMRLHEVGEEVGVTRERVRQMEVALEKSCTKHHPVFLPLISEAASIVNKHGGLITTAEMVLELLVRGENGSMLRHATPMIELLSQMPAWAELGLRVDGHTIVTADSSAMIHKASAALVQVAQEHADDRIDFSRWSIDQELLRRRLCEHLGQSSTYNGAGMISIALLDEAIKALQGIVISHGSRIYSRDMWNLHHGRLVAAAETILRLADQPMHAQEIYKALSSYRNGDSSYSERNVSAALERSAKVMLWGRGMFIHRDSIGIPYDLLSQVEGRLISQLDADVPFVSVHGAFKDFDNQCIAAGIPNEMALYTCLRESSNQALEYPRYPYAVRSGEERIPISIALEQFVRDLGGPVPNIEIRRYSSECLHINHELFDLHIYQIPNVVRFSRGMLIHKDHLEIDQARIEEVVDYALAVISDDGHVSARRVYDARTITCKILGIENPYMLHSVLLSYAPDRIGGRYPQLVAANDDDRSLGVIGQVVDYVRGRGAPCSYDELESHFVRKLGYREQTVYSVADREGVCRYAPACVVHHDTLGWNSDKQSLLEDCAIRVYDDARSMGRCFGLIADLVERDTEELPRLPRGLVWTETLAAELLSSTNRFRVLGNRHNAFVGVPNSENIATLDDLLCKLLKDNYDGAVQLDKFADDLRQLGIIRKALTSHMFGDSSGIHVRGGSVSLRELC